MDEFSTRLKQLLDYLKLTPVSLAEKMGVQRTSFNHLLSGRNKPGFEFLNRLHTCYPSINLNWLISGTGSITQDDEINFSKVEKIIEPTQSGVDLFSNIFNPPSLVQSSTLPPSELAEPTHQPTLAQSNHLDEEEIDRLIIVYKSGKMVEVKH